MHVGSLPVPVVRLSCFCIQVIYLKCTSGVPRTAITFDVEIFLVPFHVASEYVYIYFSSFWYILFILK
jgi:hypothetical protein